ncbi:MAG: hypothetical protein QXF12_04770 [Candidatus Aenigmatarchaeota archaeon]
MATYIPNITDIIPAPMLYTADVNFQLQSGITAASSYEARKKQLEDYWGKFYYSEIYNPQVDNRRKEHLLSIQKYINQYANVDLRDPDVISSFQNLFTNLYTDSIVMNGIKVSDDYRNEKAFQNYMKVSGLYDEGDPEKKSYAMYDPDLERMLDIQIEMYSRMSLDDARLSSFKIDKNLIGVNLDKLIADQLKAYGIDEGAGEVKYYMLDQNGKMAEISETEMSNIMQQRIRVYGNTEGTYKEVIGQNPVVAKVTKGGVTQTFDLSNLINDIYNSNGLVKEYFKMKSKARVFDTLKVNNFDYVKTLNSLINELDAKSTSVTSELSKYERIANQIESRKSDLASQIDIMNKLILNDFSFDSVIKLEDLIKEYEELERLSKDNKKQSSKISEMLEELRNLKKDYDYVVTPQMFDAFVENRFIPVMSNIEMYSSAINKGLNIAMNKLQEQTQTVTAGTTSAGGGGGFANRSNEDRAFLNLDLPEGKNAPSIYYQRGTDTNNINVELLINYIHGQPIDGVSSNNEFIASNFAGYIAKIIKEAGLDTYKTAEEEYVLTNNPKEIEVYDVNSQNYRSSAYLDKIGNSIQLSQDSKIQFEYIKDNDKPSHLVIYYHTKPVSSETGDKSSEASKYIIIPYKPKTSFRYSKSIN